MFPKIAADLEKLNETIVQSKEIKPLGKAYAFDYETGQHVVVDGKLQECAADENIMQWVEKVLRTEKKKNKIYTEDETEYFGISLYQYIGMKNLPPGYVASELKREITNQLLKHRYIKSVEDFKAERLKRGINISFTVVLINGETFQKGLVIDGL